MSLLEQSTLGDGILPRINIISSQPHDYIEVRYSWFRWHLYINGRRLRSYWSSDQAVLLGNFLARMASPATFKIHNGPGRPHAEVTEF